MSEFKRMSTQDAQALINSSTVTLVDIRDSISFQNGHIDGAINLDNSNIDQFVNDATKDKPLIVYCYHGNSSQSAAQFIATQGFDEVYSMDGGFEAWHGLYSNQ